MAQTPAITYSDDGAIDYTPGSAVIGGDVVVLNGIVGVAVTDIEASKKGSLAVEGIFKLPKTTAAVVRGLPIHWDPTGDPDNGTAGSGAANQLGVGTYAGICVEAAGSGVDYVATNLNVPGAGGLVGVAAVTAAGSAIGDAAALSQGLNVVTGADGTKGVQLPVAVPGMQVIVKGATAAVLKVYPQSGAVINGLSASAAMSLASGLIPAIFVASAAGQWYTIPLVPS
jgi:predicted RecA/RadA family phage recombinase